MEKCKYKSGDFCTHPDNDWDALCGIEACPLFEIVIDVFGCDTITSFIKELDECNDEKDMLLKEK